MRRLTTDDYAVDAVTAYPPSEASAGGGSTRGAKALVGAGTGHYFNGVGKIGVRREFSFDKTTGVRKGESAYYLADHSVGHKDVTGTRAMTRISEVQLFPVGCSTPARLCASDDEALIDAFVRLLREAIQHQELYGT